MIVGGIPHYFTGVGAIEQFSYPVWGYLAKKYGVIPLVRQELGSAITSLEKLEEVINNGTSAIHLAYLALKLKVIKFRN